MGLDKFANRRIQYISYKSKLLWRAQVSNWDRNRWKPTEITDICGKLARAQQKQQQPSFKSKLPFCCHLTFSFDSLTKGWFQKSPAQMVTVFAWRLFRLEVKITLLEGPCSYWRANILDLTRILSFLLLVFLETCCYLSSTWLFVHGRCFLTKVQSPEISSSLVLKCETNYSWPVTILLDDSVFRSSQ